MSEKTDFRDVAVRLVPLLREHAARHDGEGTFVTEAFEALRRERMLSMLVPRELGGGGAGFAETCDVLRILAQGCASTSLALSMHTHLVAAGVWKHRHGKPAEALLRRVANDEIGLVSTGATDWVDSVGEMVRVDGGYRVTARKVFGSGSPAARAMVTSAPYDDPDAGPRVLHFTVPLDAAGVTPMDDWDTMGMRGTGSQTIFLDGVFVPDDAIEMSRPRGAWHPAWSVVLSVAPPVYMASYVGLAEAAADAARSLAARKADDPHAVSAVGAMETELAAARLAWTAMVDEANELDFSPELARADRQLIRKTLVTRAVRATVTHALEAAGGRGFFRKLPIERCFRDAQAAHFHPLPEPRQRAFTGSIALGRDPITAEPLMS